MSIQKRGASVPSASVSRCFLIVTISGRYLALEVGSVETVLTIKELESDEDPTIQGVVDRTISLVMQLGSADMQTYPTTRVVLLADQGIRGSIRVSDVHGTLEIQPSQILPLPAQFSGAERHWYRGMILFEKSIAMILNPTWVLEATSGAAARQEGGTPRVSGDVCAIATRDGRTC